MLVVPLWRWKKNSHFTRPTAISSARSCTIHPIRAGAAILCHGMESAKNSEKLIFLAQSLAERGVLALRFDFRYVGESSGKFAEITYSGEVEDSRRPLDSCKAASPADRHLRLQHGGTVALLFAAQKANDANVAAVSPWPRPDIPRIFPSACSRRSSLSGGANAATPPTTASV